MRRWLVPAALLGLITVANAAAEPPPALIEATEKASALCVAGGGTPEILPGYDTAADLNGDGADDFLTDLAKLQCSGAWGAFCGPSGCPVTAWLSRPDDGHDRFDFGRLRGVEVRQGDRPLPEVVATYAATACGPEAVEDCSRTFVFETNAPELPPIDAPAQEAEPEPPALTGWTLRSVPGASPVALGAGIGNIASLAAFCLEGQPFLALTFHERPAGDAVALGFAFSQGEVEVSAGYEETAGGAFVVPLVEGPLADRLGGRDHEVAVSVDGRAEGTLSLDGSTRALRGALGDCDGN
jgi:hypothetical protein